VDLLLWILAVALVVIGLVGVVVPALPGTVLVFGGLVLAAMADDFTRVGIATLVVIGEWDNDTPPTMAQALFPLLVNSPGRRMVMLPEATHSMMLEKNRRMLFRNPINCTANTWGSTTSVNCY